MGIAAYGITTSDRTSIYGLLQLQWTWYQHVTHAIVRAVRHMRVSCLCACYEMHM